VAAASFGDKTHAGTRAKRAGPTDCAFHFFCLLKKSLYCHAGMLQTIHLGMGMQRESVVSP
jgi:hypothetical protein